MTRDPAQTYADQIRERRRKEGTLGQVQTPAADDEERAS